MVQTESNFSIDIECDNPRTSITGSTNDSNFAVSVGTNSRSNKAKRLISAVASLPQTYYPDRVMTFPVRHKIFDIKKRKKKTTDNCLYCCNILCFCLYGL